MLEVVAPVLQAYVPPPLAVKVLLVPKQILGLDGVIFIVGRLFTVTKRLAVAVQPEALVTVTV